MSIIAATLLFQAAAPAALPPQGRWQVDYHPEMCVLSRQFGTGDDAVTLGFQTATSSSTFMLVVLHSKNAGSATRTGKLTLSADGSLIAEDAPFVSRVSPKTRERVDTADLSRDLLPTIERATRLSIRTGKSSSVDLALAGTGKALAALTACERDLQASWGIDMATRAKVAVKPQGNPGRFFSADSYPREAYNKGQSGRVVAVLNIGTTGKVENCRIAVSSRSPSLDTETCQIAKQRLVYTPARDADNRPIATYEYLSVVWQLEY